MKPDEAVEFEQDENTGFIIRLRYWDNQAKETNTSVDNISYLKILL